MPTTTSTRPAWRQRRLLHDGWTLSVVEADAQLPAEQRVVALGATVPGCVHTDLMAAGLLGDPHLGDNEAHQHGIGRSTWRYALAFEATAAAEGEVVELVADGLDTFAVVELNGEVVARTRDQHRTHRVDVSHVLRDGDNELRVTFEPAQRHAAALAEQVGTLPNPYGDVIYPYVRKMACNDGWDWGPRLLTAGIWRPIALERWQGVRIDTVVPATALASHPPTPGDRVDVQLSVDVLLAGERADEVELRLRCAGIEARRDPGPAPADRAVVALDLADVAAWWPVGLGEPTLHDVVVEAVLDGVVVDSWAHPVGMREVAVVEQPDDEGTTWGLAVNGHPVRVRGMNWIPDHTFVTEVGPQRLDRAIEDLLDLRANLLRVWGGGLYEDDALYDRCDRAGLLVWQDFAFACAAYPEDPVTRTEVEAEARDNVRRLARHPSLVLWNGNNECVWGFHDWDWQAELDGRPWGEHHYAVLLPRVLAEEDPSRPYLPGSPWSGSMQAAPNDPTRGVTHLWDVWNQLDHAHYRDTRPSFVAEMGWCAPPARTTLRDAIGGHTTGKHTIDRDDPGFAFHFRAEDGMDKLERGLEHHVGHLDDPDAWYHALQVNQAWAMHAGVEHLRATSRCSGVVVWQLNDCWPVVSWSAVDFAGRRKPVFHALHRAFRPRLATLQPVDPHGPAGGLDVVLVNDDVTPWRTTVRVCRVDLSSSTLAEEVLAFEVPPGGIARQRLDRAVSRPGDPSVELVVLDVLGPEDDPGPDVGVDERRDTWWFASARDVELPDPGLSVVVGSARDDVGDPATRVEVTAARLARDVVLLVDRLPLVDGGPVPAGVRVDEGLVTLLAGEQVVFHVTGLTVDQLDVARLEADLTGIGAIASQHAVMATHGG